ncbi:MAG: cyclic nucleotide-binding domain-containing protein, partial [Thioalkalispiraceae bacterium]
MSSKIDKKLLKTLEPLSHLTADKLDEIAQKSRIEKLPAERILFRQGDRNTRLLYILNGQVELSIHGQKKKQIIKGKTDQARYPLAEELPRPCTARTKSEVMLLNVDQDLLEILSGDTTQQSAIEVTELSGEHDINSWMLRFLQSPAFLQLPTENIQTLLMKLEEVSYKQGDVIVKQGEESEYYYIVQKGRCSVSRRPAPKAEDIKLAILSNGDGFGEEALITGSKRNATITMLEDGNLMRLHKDDFLELLIKPLINYYNEQEVIKRLAQGSLVIDVRPHDAFMANHIEGSINIPLSMLRAKLPGLNPQRDYILVCDNGTQSQAAAFLLIQQGLTCHVLKDGFQANNLTRSAPAAIVAPKVETSKTRQADENRQLAEAKADRLKQETEKARRDADELARKAQAAEEARAAAQIELKRLKEKDLAQKDSALQSAQQQIEHEAQRAKKAEQELQSLLAEQSKNAEHQAALQKSLSQAEKVAQESARIAAEAHKQAERDAERIRKQAEKEAQQLRAEMEAERRQHEAAIEKARREEEKLQQAAVEEARQKAREAVKATANEAKAEADAIRQQAVEEAEQLRAKVEETRSQLEQSIAEAQSKGELQRQMLLEEAQREAERVAHQTTKQAELEAEQIRLKALEEAEKLRAEMEAAKQLVEQEAEKVRLKQQQEQQEQEQQEQEAAAREAQTRAEQAERERRQQQAAQAEKEKQRQQQQRVKQAQQAEEKKQLEARQRAEAIKARLEAMAREKQAQDSIQLDGLAIANFTMKEAKDRIILESD